MDRKSPEIHSQRQAASPSDGQLVQITLAGDRKAFDALIRRHQRQAVAVSYRLLGNTQDAMEVTQDAFLKAFASLGTLQKPEAFAGWLMRIVSNLSLNYRRARKTRATSALDDAIGSLDAGHAKTVGAGESMSGGGDPLHQLQSAEMGRRLQQALTELPEKQRLAIMLFTMEQLPQKEVAEKLDCSVEAVKWHIFQGRKKLKEILKDFI
jgi:RNA polymerase sigma-70 factor, ECF subfamily